MSFGIIRRTGPGMRQVVKFRDRSTGRGILGANLGRAIVYQWGLYGVRVRQRRDAALFPNYLGQTCSYRSSRPITPLTVLSGPNLGTGP